MDMYDGIERVLADRKAKRMRFAYGGDVRAGDSVGGLRGDTGGYSGRSSAGGYSSQTTSSGGGGSGGRESSTYRSPTSDNTAAQLNAQRAAQEATVQASQQAAQRAATKAAQDVAIETAIRKQAQAEYRQAPPAPYGRGTAAKGIEEARIEAQKAAAQEFYNRTVAQKIMGAEVGGQKDIFTAKNTQSSATGPGQFTKDTWLRTIEKYRPDILRTYDTKTVLDMRSTNPQLVESMLTKSVGDYSDTLVSNGIPPTQGNMYMVHFLGPVDAVKVLKGTPDAGVKDLGVSESAIEANKSILQDKTASEVTSWANRKMASAEPISIADIGTTTAQGFMPTGSIASEVNRIMGKQVYAPVGISGTRMAQAAQLTANDASVDTIEGQKTTEAPPQSGFDWSKGSWAWDTEDPARKEALYNQPNPFLGEGVVNSVTGDTPESYAQFLTEQTGKLVTPDQVKSRISTINGVPQVEFYQKEIYDIPGEMVSGLVGGIANLFKPAESKYLGAESDRSSSNQTAVKTGYGPYGNLTYEEYQRQYGGRGADNAGIATVLPVASLAPAVEQPTVAAAPTVAETPVALNPFAYTGKVTTVPTTYGDMSYNQPRIASSSIEDALSLLNKQRQLPFYTGYRTV